MKHCLIATHHGSGGTLLCRILATNMIVHCYGGTGTIYDHPTSINKARNVIDNLLGPKAGIKNESSIYVDKLMRNHEFMCKSLYRICKFIYMIRSPLVPLKTLIAKKKLTPLSAENYYLFRLRRMCEMAHKTSGILLTYEDLVTKSCFPLVKNYLGLKSPLLDQFSPLRFDDENMKTGYILSDPIEPDAIVPEDVLERCAVGYHRYLNFMEKRTTLIRFAASTVLV